MSGWTAAICTDCWFKMHPNRLPVRVKDADRETCHACGEFTMSGIYVRVDPALQKYPTFKAEED